MSGIQVLKKLREWYHAPVIVLTVRESEHDKIELLDNGADDYITKPLTWGAAGAHQGHPSQDKAGSR